MQFSSDDTVCPCCHPQNRSLAGTPGGASPNNRTEDGGGLAGFIMTGFTLHPEIDHLILSRTGMKETMKEPKGGFTQWDS